jgi:hypothetical protein
MVRKILACLLAAVLIACLGVTVARAPATSADVESVQVVYYAKGGIPGPPEGKGPGNGNGEEEEEPYVLIGLKLYEPATYYVNPTGSGVESGVIDAISDSFEAWDAVTAAELFVLGGTTDFRGRELDGENAVSWVRIVPPKVVALCTIWYEGELNLDNPAEVVEFDICFNTMHEWGIGEADAFDIQNVAAHEVGHAVGLDDLYEDENSDQTMYGYTTEGEIIKRSLEDGDKAGAQELYGVP